jgi:hypothetical protein
MRPVIRYTYCVEKHIEWAKSWVQFYAPTTSDDVIEKIFLSKYFTTKYSTTPPKKKTQEEIKTEAAEDLADYLDKVEKRIGALKNVEKREKLLEKVMEELPGVEDLFDILMSYRIYDTEGKTRIRRPSSVALSVAKNQENNNENNKNNKNN